MTDKNYDPDAPFYRAQQEAIKRGKTMGALGPANDAVVKELKSIKRYILWSGLNIVLAIYLVAILTTPF